SLARNFPKHGTCRDTVIADALFNRIESESRRITTRWMECALRDLRDETLISMKQGKMLPCPTPPSEQTLTFWCRKGLCVITHPGRPRVVLESTQEGGYVYTSIEAYERWRSEINRLRNEGIMLKIRGRSA